MLELEDVIWQAYDPTSWLKPLLMSSVVMDVVWHALDVIKHKYPP